MTTNMASGGNSFTLKSTVKSSAPTIKQKISWLVFGATFAIFAGLILSMSGLFREQLNIHTDELLVTPSSSDPAMGFSFQHTSGWVVFWVIATVAGLMIFGAIAVAQALNKDHFTWLYLIGVISCLAIGLTTPSVISMPKYHIDEWAALRYGVTIKNFTNLTDGDMLRDTKTKNVMTVHKVDQMFYLYDTLGVHELPVVLGKK